VKQEYGFLSDVGIHLCQFYQNKEDLIDVLVPYFKAGLENNEFCMWITSEPLGVEDAKTSLKRTVENLDDYIETSQIQVLDASQWYTKSGKFESSRVLEGWIEKENQIIERGFDRLRVAGNTSWLDGRDWREFIDYEATVNNIIGNHRMIAICSYSLDKCGPCEIIDVVSNHRSALIKQGNGWETIENSGCKRMGEEFRQSGEELERIIESSRSTRQHLLDWYENLTSVENTLSRPLGGAYSISINAFIKLAFQNIVGTLSDLEYLTELSVAHRADQEVCHLFNCPKLAALTDALVGTIDVLRKTKGSFKSSELGELRQKLERVVRGREGRAGEV